MSTAPRVFRYFSIPAVLLSSALLAACATAWSGSTSAGGRLDDEIGRAVEEIAVATPMTPFCKVVGRRLLEMAVASKVAAVRPTKAYWERKEDEAAGAWEASQCPMPALAALAFASSEIGNADYRRRTSGVAGR